MIDRFKAASDSIRETRKVEHGRETELEKGDFTALVAAAWATMGKTAVLTMGFFVAVAALLLMIWGH